ncbi:unnamed protein product [Brassica napus]|uniref:(rape) hypothetical protein n=1 Tax=Brassica napus TaxID=3708 RepID=A0A816L8P7_BRANA|nr:unnamed protein product [Brassica napus]
MGSLSSPVLELARPFLRGELEKINPKLPSLIAVLKSVGAGECWYKHGSFLHHLVDVYKILKLWKAPEPVCLCGLFHSAYSNSYVNLAIFDPSTGRDVVRGHVGEYSDLELIEHLELSEVSLRKAKEEGVFDGEEVWRKKLNGLVPENGVVVKHIKTGEEVLVSRRVVGVFLLMTMADFSDQFFGFRDELFCNNDGRLEFRGNNVTALWPGDGKPGLWMNSSSRMGGIYNLIVREEEILMEQRKRGYGSEFVARKERDEDIELVVPPVFSFCTKVLDAKEQIEARDTYWEAVSSDASKEGYLERAEERLLVCIEKNPFVGEPHVLLSQVYLGRKRFLEAEREAERGLVLLLQWGSPWDKRMSWEGWIAWVRVLLMKSSDQSWPDVSWGILNLGLVR